jgi:hypothetical protein
VRRISPRVAYASAGLALVLVLAVLGSSGHGLPALGMQLRSGQAWLANVANHSISFIDGYSGEVVSQVAVPGGSGQVVNTPHGAVVVGKNGRMITVSNDNFTTSGPVELLGGSALTAAAGTNALYAVNQATGQIQQLDASSPQLPAIGAPVSVGSPVVSPVVAPDGSLYVGIPKSGAVGHVMNSRLAVIKGVSQPGSPLAVVLAGTQPVAASLDAAVVTPLGATAVSGPAVRLPASARPIKEVTGSDSLNGVIGAVGPHAVDSANVMTDAVSSIPLPSAFSATGVAMQGPNVVLIDKVSRDVLFVNTVDRTTRTLRMPGKLPPDQLTVTDGLVFVNASDGPSAMVISGDGQWKPVTKYTTPPPRHPKPAKLPAPPPPHVRQPHYVKPQKPGAPPNPAAVAGNGTAAVSWGPAPANGSPVTRYRLTWSGNGAAGRAMLRGITLGRTVTGLANGSAYTFTIQAENAVGWGPAVTAGPVTPSSTVPAAPSSVRAATPADNGSVALSWTEPDNGDAIKSYTVTEVGTGQVVASRVTGTSVTIPGVVTAASTTFGPVEFEVTAVDGANRESAPSTPSSRVTPYLPPLAPAVAATAYTLDGGSATLTVSCGAGCFRGNVGSYTVTLGGSARPVTGTAAPDGSPVQITLTGLTPNTSYTAQVTAQDAAGAASAATAASLMTDGPPIVTGVTVSPVTGMGPGNSPQVDVTTQVNPGGEQPSQCSVSITVNGGASASSLPCNGTQALGVPMYNSSYTVTVTATNVVGSSAPVTSPAGMSSMKALAADATTAFGPPGSCPPGGYCGGDSHLQPGPGFTSTNPAALVTQGTTVYATCQTSGGRDTGTYGAYRGVVSTQWLGITGIPQGTGYMSNLWFGDPATAAAGLPGC